MIIHPDEQGRFEFQKLGCCKQVREHELFSRPRNGLGLPGTLSEEISRIFRMDFFFELSG
jgi:hypothetical protein